MFSDHVMVIVNRSSCRLEAQKCYRKARNFKNFDRQKFAQDIWDHELYIQNLYEKDPQIIADNLTEILQNCLDLQAPVRTIQIPKQAAHPISDLAKETQPINITKTLETWKA